jgi:hypothetical protein
VNKELKMAFLILLVAAWANKPRAERNLPAPKESFADLLISLVNHRVTVFTSASDGFEGLLTSANPDFITLFQRAAPPQAIFIPLSMISAVTLSTNVRSSSE